MVNPKTHISEFDRTLAKSRQWLKELREIAALNDESDAYSILKPVLHALRDRLPVDEAAQLASEMPMLIRGLYFEGWKPSAVPVKSRTMDAFLDGINATTRALEHDKRRCVGSVFRLLSKHISSGEIEDVRQALPAKIRQCWPD